MNLVSSYDLFEKLFSLELLKDSPKNWWPGYGTFEVILGALLTQNTTFTKVEISLGNLRRSDLLQLDKWKDLSTIDIMELIIPSGLYRQKSQRLIDLTQA
ncbi:MAG: 3-methyladenine DNA glycosylase, partial [Thiovulaceae bacterium]|nr:3-methyladenine DNA glycosylase [Sulfurimonadaceae bacterium]